MYHSLAKDSHGHTTVSHGLRQTYGSLTQFTEADRNITMGSLKTSWLVFYLRLLDRTAEDRFVPT